MGNEDVKQRNIDTACSYVDSTKYLPRDRAFEIPFPPAANFFIHDGRILKNSTRFFSRIDKGEETATKLAAIRWLTCAGCTV